MPEPLTLAAAVLAGGQSRRMGRDKAFLELGGGRLLDRQLSLVRTLQPAEVLISGRRGVDYGCPGVRVVCDLREQAGPLAALESVMHFTTASHVLVLAVDLPAVSSEFLAALWRRARPDCGVVPLTSHGWEPLVAVYPRCCAGRVTRLLDAGRRALHELVEEARSARELESLEMPPAAEALFVNWNCPDDYRP